MESDNNNFFKSTPLEQDVNLAALRRRHKKLILVFKFFFISITIIIAALIIYLVQSNTLESDQSIRLNPGFDQTSYPIIYNESQIFALSLKRAAEELEYISSLIISNYSSTNTDQLAFKNCLKSLQNVSGQIRNELEIMEAIPFSEKLSNRQRAEMMNRITVAEKKLELCVDDLMKVESTAANEVTEVVIQAQFYLRSRGDFLMMSDGWRKLWSELIAAVSGFVFENMFIMCICLLQLLFLFYLFWNVFKFR